MNAQLCLFDILILQVLLQQSDVVCNLSGTLYVVDILLPEGRKTIENN
jgi:hypothetical protein